MVDIFFILENNVSQSEMVSTDSTGQVSISISDVSFPISLTYNALKDGFITSDGAFIVKNDEPETSLTLSLTPELEPNQRFRLVLNWGQLPKDLDLHTLQYSNSTQFCETFYNNKNGCEGLNLDVDNTLGGDKGAETITWTEPGDNWYLLYVYDYSEADTTLVQSEVRFGRNI